MAKAHQLVSQRGGLLLAEYGQLEKTLHVGITHTPGDAVPQQALVPEGADRLLAMLLTLPHGVLKHSHAVEGGRTGVE
jgi:dipeptidase D